MHGGNAGAHRPAAASSVSSGSRRLNRYSRCRLYAQHSSVGSRCAARASPAPILSFTFELPPYIQHTSGVYKHQLTQAEGAALRNRLNVRQHG